MIYDNSFTLEEMMETAEGQMFTDQGLAEPLSSDLYGRVENASYRFQKKRKSYDVVNV